MSGNASPEPEAAAAGREAAREYVGGVIPRYPYRTPSEATGSWEDTPEPDPTAERESARQALGALRIEIQGSWSVADLIKLLGRLDDGYKAAAALESLAAPRSGVAALNAGDGSQSASPSADDLLRIVTAFQLAGGLRLGSLHYGSPGFVEVIGALNPLKTVKDGITENRDVNRKRDETRRLDEREREKQAMQHREAMTREGRASEQQLQSYELEVARFRLEAETARFNAMRDLIDRLPTDQQSVAAAELLQRLMGATEAISNDARIDGARMLELANSASTAPTRQDDIPEVPEPRQT